MDQAKVGKFIASLRKEKGLTQEELGQRVGVTNKTVSRWENGNYMPDIELLVPLGEILGVSVNELLAGELLSGEQFRKQADENLVSMVLESAFTVKERGEFFKKKWLREHVWLIIVCALVCTLVTVRFWQKGGWGLWIVAYCWLNNRMMSYIEGRLYGGPKPPTDG